jgi:hypothetical protein
MQAKMRRRGQEMTTTTRKKKRQRHHDHRQQALTRWPATPNEQQATSRKMQDRQKLQHDAPRKRGDGEPSNLAGGSR